ncbi:MAG: rhodanese-like domain-containing protein [Microthrixaceae bacterium]
MATTEVRDSEPAEATQGSGVLFEQHYLDCLSQASYVVADRATGRAVVVDPAATYTSTSQQPRSTVSPSSWSSRPFHADFLSGHLELAVATGAEIALGPTAQAEYPHRSLSDGERIPLGEVTLEIRHTPGHTPESISIMVWEHPGDIDDPDGVPFGVLTGDTMFIGDVGHDPLASFGVTADRLATSLYHSLHDQLHAARRDQGLPGPRRRLGLRQISLDRDGVDHRRTAREQLRARRHDPGGLHRCGHRGPAQCARLLRPRRRAQPQSRELLDDEAGCDALELDRVLALREEGALVIDTRDQAAFAQGHVEGSVNIALDGRFAEYAGSVVRPHEQIVLVSDPGTEVEARTRLARIGFDEVAGHLDGPYRAMQQHPEHVERASRLTADEFAQRRVGAGPAGARCTWALPRQPRAWSRVRWRCPSDPCGTVSRNPGLLGAARGRDVRRWLPLLDRRIAVAIQRVHRCE